MRSFWKSALLLLMAATATVTAQNHPYPGSAMSAAVICIGCPGTNSVGQLNDGLPTYPYTRPLAKHVGRFVDSSNTVQVQNLGMRTIRAGMVRVAPTQNRIYLQLGATVGAYTLDTFFSSKLQEVMVTIKSLVPSASGRNPFEKLARWDQYFYAEANAANWDTPLVDSNDVLRDFDTDDRGNLYIGTANFGWGISSDPGSTNQSHLPTVVQVPEDSSVAYLMSLHSGSSYYVYYSNGLDESTLYDVTSAASPVFVATRTGNSNVIQAGWSKYEVGERVATRNLYGHVRIYSYAGLIAGSAPLADVTPTAGRQFAGISFDDDGNLWLAESNTGATITENLLWKLTPSGGGYTTTTFSVYGSVFAPDKIHASAGYIVVGGRSAGPTPDELRLLRVSAGTPQLLETDNFFRRYYHKAPSGYAQPGTYGSTLTGLRIVAQGAKTYLFYSAFGLGDVYELNDDPGITSIAPRSGSPLGGTNVDIYGLGFTADATVTFGGLTASSSFVNTSHLTAVAPVHASGSVDVVVTVPSLTPMTAPHQFTYILDTPQNVAANATSTDSITVSWNAVAGAMSYEVSRLQPEGTWTVIGTPAVTTLIDDGRTAETTYVYRVRADDGAAHFSASSAIDLATTMSSQSATIVAGAPVLAIDFTNLRTRVNAVRAATGTSDYSFTGTITGTVLALHVSELRTALAEGRTSLGLTTPAFTDPSLTDVTIKAVHLNELLDLMR